MCDSNSEVVLVRVIVQSTVPEIVSGEVHQFHADTMESTTSPSSASAIHLDKSVAVWMNTNMTFHFISADVWNRMTPQSPFSSDEFESAVTPSPIVSPIHQEEPIWLNTNASYVPMSADVWGPKSLPYTPPPHTPPQSTSSYLEPAV